MNDILKGIGRYAAKGREKLVEISHDLILSKETVPLRDDIEHGNDCGDFVVAEGRFAMVGKKKTKNSRGIVIRLDMPLKKWHYQLKYNPYTQLVNDEGGCCLKTGAISLEDGVSNTNIVKLMQNKLDNEEHNPFRCPPNSYYFPLYDYQKKCGERWFVPSIKELSKVFSNRNLWKRFTELLSKTGKAGNLSETVFLWSSTEHEDWGMDAYALSVSDSQPPKIERVLKETECYAILYKFF